MVQDTKRRCGILRAALLAALCIVLLDGTSLVWGFSTQPGSRKQVVSWPCHLTPLTGPPIKHCARLFPRQGPARWTPRTTQLAAHTMKPPSPPQQGAKVTPVHSPAPSPAPAPPATSSAAASPTASSPTAAASPDLAVRSKISKALQFFTFARWIRRNLEPPSNRIGGRARGPKADRRLSWMRSPAFQKLTLWAFRVCDTNGSGRINCDELYTGALLVHLHLAKRIGLAACHPLNRTQVEDLFQTADVDGVGTIGVTDFEEIVLLSCAHIGSRVAVFGFMLAFVTPKLVQALKYVVAQFLQTARHPRLSGKLATNNAIASFFWKYSSVVVNSAYVAVEWILQHAVSILVFVVIVPWVFEKIDNLTSLQLFKLRRVRRHQRIREQKPNIASKMFSFVPWTPLGNNRKANGLSLGQTDPKSEGSTSTGPSHASRGSPVSTSMVGRNTRPSSSRPRRKIGPKLPFLGRMKIR